MSLKRIAESIQKMVLEHPTKSVEQISEDAFGVDEQGEPRKARWTVYREMNPDDKGAKVGALDLMLYMKACGSIEPLQLMANEMGCRVVCLKEAAPLRPETAHKEVSDVTIKLARVIEKLNQAAKDGRYDKAEMVGVLAACIEAHEELEDLTAGAAAGANA